jgi:hypothetical protein
VGIVTNRIPAACYEADDGTKQIDKAVTSWTCMRQVDGSNRGQVMVSGVLSWYSSIPARDFQDGGFL